MRMKTFKAVRNTAHWIEKLLDVRLPVGIVAGLRTR
jgi:hypothetical protein